MIKSRQDFIDFRRELSEKILNSTIYYFEPRSNGLHKMKVDRVLSVSHCAGYPKCITVTIDPSTEVRKQAGILKIPLDEGEVIKFQFWLSSEDDEKAKKIFLHHINSVIFKHEKEIERLNEMKKYVGGDLG